MGLFCRLPGEIPGDSECGARPLPCTMLRLLSTSGTEPQGDRGRGRSREALLERISSPYSGVLRKDGGSREPFVAADGARRCERFSKWESREDTGLYRSQ